MSQNDVMNFLNEIAIKNPSAVSFASGRPLAKFLGHTDWSIYEQKFIQWFAAQQGLSESKAKNKLYHYGPSAGIICKLLERYCNKSARAKSMLSLFVHFRNL